MTAADDPESDDPGDVGSIGPAPGTDAQDVTEEPDTETSAEPRPDRPQTDSQADSEGAR